MPNKIQNVMSVCLLVVALQLVNTLPNSPHSLSTLPIVSGITLMLHTQWIHVPCMSIFVVVVAFVGGVMGHERLTVTHGDTGDGLQWLPWIAGGVCVVTVSIVIALLIFLRKCPTKSFSTFPHSDLPLFLWDIGKCETSKTNHNCERDMTETFICGFPLVHQQTSLMQCHTLSCRPEHLATLTHSSSIGCMSHHVAMMGPLGTSDTTLQRGRGVRKSLYASRRGSHASLTLSMSSSMDSLNTQFSMPGHVDLSLQEQEILRNATAPLSLDQLQEKLTHSLTGCHDDSMYKEFIYLPMNCSSPQDIAVAQVWRKTRYQIFPKKYSDSECAEKFYRNSLEFESHLSHLPIATDLATRVVLPQEGNDPLTTYINANHVQGYQHHSATFIATQGPMPSTILDFWRMVWMSRCPLIVMVTDFVEKRKVKCERYFPEHGSASYGAFHVVVQRWEIQEGFVERTFILTCESENERRIVHHIWYREWQDHSVPNATETQVLNMLTRCRELYSLRQDHAEGVNRPVIVHCSAGLGRTGCFLALWIASEQFQTEASVDLLGTVARLRLQRGGMVDTWDQYRFLHRALLTYGLRKHFGWNDNKLSQSITITTKVTTKVHSTVNCNSFFNDYTSIE